MFREFPLLDGAEIKYWECRSCPKIWVADSEVIVSIPGSTKNTPSTFYLINSLVFVSFITIHKVEQILNKGAHQLLHLEMFETHSDSSICN